MLKYPLDLTFGILCVVCGCCTVTWRWGNSGQPLEHHRSCCCNWQGSEYEIRRTREET